MNLKIVAEYGELQGGGSSHWAHEADKQGTLVRSPQIQMLSLPIDLSTIPQDRFESMATHPKFLEFIESLRELVLSGKAVIISLENMPNASTSQKVDELMQILGDAIRSIPASPGQIALSLDASHDNIQRSPSLLPPTAAQMEGLNSLPDNTSALPFSMRSSSSQSLQGTDGDDSPILGTAHGLHGISKAPDVPAGWRPYQAVTPPLSRGEFQLMMADAFKQSLQQPIDFNGVWSVCGVELENGRKALIMSTVWGQFAVDGNSVKRISPDGQSSEVEHGEVRAKILDLAKEWAERSQE